MEYRTQSPLSLKKTIYWICDCNSIEKLLEYTGNVYQPRRWSREMIAITLASFIGMPI